MGVVAKPTTQNRDKHMKTKNKYVGLDVHKDTTVVAVADSGRDAEVRLYGEISSDLGALEKVLRKLGGEGVTLHVVYEAGPTGFVIYRRLQQLGIDCIVVAPTKTPQERGLRQKTDRRDAILLARLHRAGELTAIHVPDAVDESVRGHGIGASLMNYVENWLRDQGAVLLTLTSAGHRTSARRRRAAGLPCAAGFVW